MADLLTPLQPVSTASRNKSGPRELLLLATTGALIALGAILALSQLPRVLSTWVPDALILPVPAAAIAAASVFQLRWLPPHVRRPALVLAVVATLVALTSFVPVVACALLFASAAAIGTWFLPSSQPKTPPALAAATVVGLGALLAVFSLLMPFPVNRPWVYALILLAPMLLRFRDLEQWLRSVAQPEGTLESRWEWLARFLAMIAAISAVAGAFYPIVEADDTFYHLRLPTQLFHLGQYTFDIKYFLSATNPFASDLLFAIPFVTSNGDTSVHTSFGVFYSLACGVLLWDLVREKAGPAMSWLTVAVFFSAPMTHYLNHSMHTELPMTVFALTGFWLIFRSVGPLSLAAMGLIGGSLLAIKLSGVALAGGLALLTLWRARQERRLSLTRAAEAAAVGLTAGLPAYIWSYKLTGNPIFPLFNDIFKSPLIPPDRAVDFRWIGNLQWTFLFDIYADTPKFVETIQSGASDVSLLILAPAAIVFGLVRGSFPVRAAIGICLLHAAMVLATMQYIRYLFPVVAVLLIAVASTASALAEAASWRKAAISAAFVLTVGLNLMVMGAFGWSTRGQNVWSIVTDRERARKYIADHAPMRLFAKRINAILTRRHKILMLGAMTAGEVAPTTVFVRPYLSPEPSEALSHVRDPVDAVRFLKRFGITHTLIAPAAVAHWEEHAILLMRKLGKPIFTGFDYVLYDVSHVHFVSEEEALAKSEVWISKVQRVPPGGPQRVSSTNALQYVSDLAFDGTENPAQLLTGFHRNEGVHWRWAQRRFAIALASPQGSAQKGATLNLSVAIMPLMLTDGPIEIAARVEGEEVGVFRFDTEGQHTARYEISPHLLSSASAQIEFTVSREEPHHGMVVARASLVTR